MTAKIHAICDALGNSVKLARTPGQDADSSQAEPMLENIDPNAFLADRAYDADRLIDRLTERGMIVVIPPKRHNEKQTSLFIGRETLSSTSSIKSNSYALS